MEWIVGILIVALIIWVGVLQKRVSGLEDWQDRLIPSLDEELLPIRKKLNLIEPWETLIIELNIDEETAKSMSGKGFNSAQNIVNTDQATFIANCGLDSVPRAKTIYETAVRITNPEKEVK
ncbi:MAG: hypothetical protein PHW01_02285 [Patescibacteria group bacterium]|nr:hypothetical protein [Patescibacteria group bacterium]